MPYALGKRSLQNLSGAHPDLLAVVKRATDITADPSKPVWPVPPTQSP